MMNILDETLNLFNIIISKKDSFSNVVNKHIEDVNLDESDKRKVKDALKSVVNRYYFLRYELKDIIKKEYSKDEMNLLIISLAFARFVKGVTPKDVNSFLEDSILKHNYKIDIVQAYKRIDSIYQTPLVLDATFKDNIMKKFALKFSYPEWLVRTLASDYGLKRAYDILDSTKKQYPISVSLNIIKNDYSYLDNKEDFEKSELSQTSYLYVGKRKLNDISEYITSEIFVLDQSEEHLVDVLDLFQGDKVLYYGKNNASLALSILIRLNDFGKVYYANEDYKSINNLNKRCNQFALQNMVSINSSLDLLITHLSENSMDKVICMPPSSELGLARRKPEISLSLSHRDIDDFVKKQKEYIHSLAKYVKDGGTYIYAVPTLGKKETSDIVDEFLKNNEEFILEKEETIFPSTYKCDGIYIAKFIKGLE